VVLLLSATVQAGPVNVILDTDIRTVALVAMVYLLSGLCASLAGVVSVPQLGAVSPTFGYQREFAAIAAAVLGGTSLYGGRGSIFPGTLLGAVLIQSVESGLQAINADPVITGGVIFCAVLLDRLARQDGTAARIR
jgi:ribose transport system permease protein